MSEKTKEETHTHTLIYTHLHLSRRRRESVFVCLSVFLSVKKTKGRDSLSEP